MGQDGKCSISTGICLSCDLPVKPEMVLGEAPEPLWHDTISNSGPLCNVEAYQPTLPELPLHPVSSEPLPLRRSFHSWTAYEDSDPYAQPNRYTHEVSSDQLGEFLSEVTGHQKAFKDLIRKKRGTTSPSVGIIGWAKSLFETR